MCTQTIYHFPSPSKNFLLLSMIVLLLLLCILIGKTDSVAIASCCCPEGYIHNGRKNGRGCHYTEIINWLSLKFCFRTGTIIGLPLALIYIWVYTNNNRKKEIRQQFFDDNGGKLLLKELDKRKRSSDKRSLIKVYSAEDIKGATSNYSNNCIIMQESCKPGTVIYRGTTPDENNNDNNTDVIIMKIEQVPLPEIKHFVRQLQFLSQPHRNLVRLIGCCLETESPLLVYELHGDGTHTLLDKIQDRGFSSQKRLKVAVDAARALNHLHSNRTSGAKAHIYGNIRSSNILLDDSYNAKLFYAFDQYSCGRGAVINEKSDVCGFGTVLKELLGCQKSFAQYPSIELQVQELANRCSSEKVRKRPKMKEVEKRLSKLITMTGNVF